MRALLVSPSHRRLRTILKLRHVCGFAIAALALVLPWPAAAQTPVTFCD
jgi:4-amino-4-deoxy-L-arabinose transferase-like glycosyltransferase